MLPLFCVCPGLFSSADESIGYLSVFMVMKEHITASSAKQKNKIYQALVFFMRFVDSVNMIVYEEAYPLSYTVGEKRHCQVQNLT